MGWLRLVGSLKLQVSIAEYSLFYMALLQKRPVILRSLLIAATPYDMTHMYGEAACSGLHKIIGLFCKGALWKRRYSAKETSNFKETTNRSHPIGECLLALRLVLEGLCVCACVCVCVCMCVCVRVCVCVCVLPPTYEAHKCTYSNLHTICGLRK